MATKFSTVTLAAAVMNAVSVFGHILSLCAPFSLMSHR